MKSNVALLRQNSMHKEKSIGSLNLNISYVDTAEAYVSFMVQGLNNLTIRKSYSDEEYKEEQRTKYEFK